MPTENNLDYWDKLSKEQQQGILDALAEVEINGGRSHEDVIAEMRNRWKQ